MRITQKLPLKKVYKLSPNLAAAGKFHRVRNKSYMGVDEECIIVDEVDGKIVRQSVFKK